MTGSLVINSFYEYAAISQALFEEIIEVEKEKVNIFDLETQLPRRSAHRYG